MVWMWRNLDQLPQHAAVRTRLLNQARRFHNEIYGDSLPNDHVLEAAWRLRGEDPMSHLEHIRSQIAPVSKLRSLMKTSLDRALRIAPTDARELWWRALTDSEVQRRGEELVDIELVEDELHALRDLQDLVLRRLVKQRLVIEANPSSNLAIGPFSKIAEHPIFRWAPPEGGHDALRPIVVVGSDDPAIFGSELIHEFALLALAAEQRGYSPRAIGRWLQELNQHARAFRFDGGMGPPRQ
ncbi:hypothetical protein L6R46_10435 [Myxococcota bacterium]|nr:hypothetical protein [Myxococcota bacterium]